MKFLDILVALVIVSATASAAAKSKECQIRVIRPVVDDLGNHWKPGKILLVDIERDNPDGGAFCAHGGSCLPRRSDNAKSVQLINCTVGPPIDSSDRRLERR